MAKFVQDLNVSLSQDIEQLEMKDSEFARSIKNLQDALASLGGPVTNYGTTTLMKEYSYTTPTHNDYYPAPHTKGYAQVNPHLLLYLTSQHCLNPEYHWQQPSIPLDYI